MEKETPEHEKLWDEFATDLVNRNEIRSALSYMRGIREFKASLREEIENLLKITENELENNTIEKQAWMEALEKTLQLLDTVKPSTSQPEGNTVNQQKH